jgi:hypothetical protein
MGMELKFTKKPKNSVTNHPDQYVTTELSALGVQQFSVTADEPVFNPVLEKDIALTSTFYSVSKWYQQFADKEKSIGFCVMTPAVKPGSAPAGAALSSSRIDTAGAG